MLLAIGLALWPYAIFCTVVFAAWRAFRLRSKAKSRRALATTSATRVLLVRPCRGDEPHLGANLISAIRARRSFDLRCRIVVTDAEDPAAGAAAIAAGTLRDAGMDATLVFSHADAPNHKSAQIAAALAAERAPYDVVLIVDSDVDLSRTDLDALVAPLADDGDVRATWAPPIEENHLGSKADLASAALLTSSLHAFVLLGAIDPSGLVGKTMAVRRGALEAAGGFEGLTHVLGEDMELARRLRAVGGAIQMAPTTAQSLRPTRTWSDVVDRLARWLTVIRAQRPALIWSYPAIFFAAPLQVTLALLLAPWVGSAAIPALVVALVWRTLAAIVARRSAGLPLDISRLPLAIVLSDLLLAHAFYRALTRRTIAWRGSSLNVEAGGLLRRAA